MFENDLLCEIRYRIKELPLTISWKWIKGHQDQGTSLQDLDMWSKANIVCDSMAKMHWNQYIENRTKHKIVEFKSEGWKVYKDGLKISSMNKKLVFASIHKPTIMKY